MPQPLLLFPNCSLPAPHTASMLDGSEITIDAPDAFPTNLALVQSFYEPTVIGTLICPSEHLGKMIALCEVCNSGSEVVGVI